MQLNSFFYSRPLLYAAIRFGNRGVFAFELKQRLHVAMYLSDPPITSTWNKRKKVSMKTIKNENLNLRYRISRIRSTRDTHLSTSLSSVIRFV